MATYTINYLNGETDTVTADRITSDERPVDYTFSNDSQIVAVIPITNVRSILREDPRPTSTTASTEEISRALEDAADTTQRNYLGIQGIGSQHRSTTITGNLDTLTKAVLAAKVVTR